jgi:hypothetical protein
VSTKPEEMIKIKAGVTNQREKAFNRGNVISAACNIKGNM